MNKKTLTFIFSVAVTIITLLSISVRITSSGIDKGIEERKNKNILQEIIDATNNEHPVLNESLKGKTTVINVWATWCGPCLREMPELNQMVKDFASDTVRFIAFDAEESSKETKIMQEKEINFDYELLFDQESMIKLLYSYKLENEGRAIPLHIIINKKGHIEFFHMGSQKKNLIAMREYLEDIDLSSISIQLI